MLCSFDPPVTRSVSLRKTRFIQPHVLFTGVYLLKRLSAGFLPCAGLRLLALRQFQALLASSARPACASSFCFRSILGLAALWLTGQSSRPAFGGRLTLFVRKTWKALIQRCICRGDPPFCGALFGMSFLRLSLHFSYLKMLQNAKFWCSIFLPMPGPYSVYQVASLDCWHIGLCTIHPWPKQSPQMTLSNQAVKRTGLRPAAYFVR